MHESLGNAEPEKSLPEGRYEKNGKKANLLVKLYQINLGKDGEFCTLAALAGFMRSFVEAWSKEHFEDEDDARLVARLFLDDELPRIAQQFNPDFTSETVSESNFIGYARNRFSHYFASTDKVRGEVRRARDQLRPERGIGEDEYDSDGLLGESARIARNCEGTREDHETYRLFAKSAFQGWIDGVSELSSNRVDDYEHRILWYFLHVECCGGVEQRLDPDFKSNRCMGDFSSAIATWRDVTMSEANTDMAKRHATRYLLKADCMNVLETRLRHRKLEQTRIREGNLEDTRIRRLVDYVHEDCGQVYERLKAELSELQKDCMYYAS